MRNALLFATLSFLAILQISCSNGPGGGPPTFLKAEPENPDLSADDLFDKKRGAVLTYQMGPFNLPANTGAAGMIAKPAVLHFTVEEAIWLQSFEPSIEDVDGNPLPKELVHEIILINNGEANTFCTTKQVGNPFAATTSSMEKIALPEGHGYPITPSDPLEATVVLKNPTSENYYGVHVKFVLTGELVDGAKPIVNVRPLMIDTDPCDHKPISIAPGQFVEKSESVPIPEDGSIIKAYGLLQNYGISVTMSKGEGDEPFWKGVATIDENYQITSLPPFDDPAGVAVNRGEDLSLVVAYNNSSDNWYDEATAAVMTYMALSKEEAEESEAPPEAEETAAATDVQQKLLF